MTTHLQLPTRSGRFRVAIDGPEDAPALIFSNSLGTTLEMWDSQAAAFASTHKVIRYDTRGHGGSPVTPGPYTFDQLGDDVLAILDALQLQQAFFCGISMGGHTGLWLAIHAPERLHGAVISNSAARIGSLEAWQERSATVLRDGQAAMRALAESSPQRWFTPTFVAAQPHTVVRAQTWIAETLPAGYAACCDALAVSDLRQAQAGIAVPTLLIAGQFDPVTTVADAEHMQQAIDHAQLATVPASHLSNIEAPEAFDAALRRFLNAVQ